MKLKALLSTALVTGALVYAPVYKAQALTGLVIANKSTAVTGGVVTGIGAVVGATGYVSAIVAGGSFINVFASALVGTGLIMAGGLTGAIGIVILEGEQNTIRYAPLNSEQSSELGLTQAQFQAFNTEIDIINAVADDVSATLDQMGTVSVDAAGQLWTERADMISDDAKVALFKVSENLLNQLQAN